MMILIPICLRNSKGMGEGYCHCELRIIMIKVRNFGFLQQQQVLQIQIVMLLIQCLLCGDEKNKIDFYQTLFRLFHLVVCSLAMKRLATCVFFLRVNLRF